VTLADRTIGACAHPFEVQNLDDFEMRGCGDAGPFSVFDTRYGGLTTDVHAHTWCSIHWVLSGEVEERYAGRPRAARRGDMLLYAPGIEHQTRVSKDARIVHVPLYAHASPDCSGSAGGLDAALFVEALALACHALDDESQASAARRDHLGGRLASSLAQRDCVRLDGRARDVHREALLRTRRPDCSTLRGAADQLGLSRSQAARFVRARWGCSVGELNRARQLQRAARLLLDPARSLAEVSSICGFSDQSHFGRAFRESVGLTPGAFRRTIARSSDSGS